MPLLFENGGTWLENGWYDGFDATDDDVWYDDARPLSKLAVECREPEPEPDELPGLSRPGDCVKSIPEWNFRGNGLAFLQVKFCGI